MKTSSIMALAGIVAVAVLGWFFFWTILYRLAGLALLIVIAYFLGRGIIAVVRRRPDDE